MKIDTFTKTFQNEQVLSFPGYEIKPGQIISVIGANGSGKSTFARILSGILPSDQNCSPFEGKMNLIGYLPQKPYVFRMSLYQNLMISEKRLQKNSQTRADKLLHALNLTSLSNKNALTLSGGEASRMCLARLLMQDYQLLILDEPCASMDIASTLQAEALIRDYVKETGASVILITHNLGQARRLSDEILFFHKGHLCESGSSTEFFSHPNQEETKVFLNFYS